MPRTSYLAMHDRRLPAAMAVWLLASCAPAVGEDELVVPEPAYEEPVLLRPDATGRDASERATAEGSVASGRVACMDLLGDATGQVRADLTEICNATSHDGSCVGFACARTASREGLECLLHAGQEDRIIALETAAEPAARSMAREVIERRNAWTPARIQAAILDDMSVGHCGGCLCDDEPLSNAGVRAALNFEDRDAMLPLLDRWLDTKPHAPLLAQALAARGDEAWITDADLRTILTAAKLDTLRAAAAAALVRRGDQTLHVTLYQLAHSTYGDTQTQAIGALDFLDDATAWDELSDLRKAQWHDVPGPLLRLATRLRPKDALPWIDANTTNAAAAAWLLPTKQFAKRAVTTLCSFTPPYDGTPAQLAHALSKVPEPQRCRILRGEAGECAPYTKIGDLAHRYAPELAAACRVPVPKDLQQHDVGWPEHDCERVRDARSLQVDADERARVLQIEARAKAAAAQR